MLFTVHVSYSWCSRSCYPARSSAHWRQGNHSSYRTSDPSLRVDGSVGAKSMDVDVRIDLVAEELEVGHIEKNLVQKEDRPDLHAFLRAARAHTSQLTTERQEVLVPAASTSNAGEAVAQDTATQKGAKGVYGAIGEEAKALQEMGLIAVGEGLFRTPPRS